jgi:hypothetical protein
LHFSLISNTRPVFCIILNFNVLVKWWQDKLYNIRLRTLCRITNLQAIFSLYWRRQQQVPPKHCYTYQTTRCHNPEHHNINLHHCAMFIDQLSTQTLQTQQNILFQYNFSPTYFDFTS